MNTKEPTARIEYRTPRVDLHHDDEGYTLEVEMPGVSKEGVDLTVDNGKLTIIGQRKDVAPQGGRPVYRERTVDAYRRVFDLDPSIDTANINAGIEQGLLRLHLQKAESAKPRKITVG